MQIEITVHADREAMWEKGPELGLRDGPLKFFTQSCNEVRLTLDVRPDGKTTIIRVNGREVL